MPDFAYIAELTCAGLVGTLEINGWPVYRVQGAEPRLVSVKLNPWLLEGTNELSLTLARIDGGHGLVDDGERCQLRLFRAVPDQDYIHDFPVLYFCWSEPEHRLAAAPATVFRHAFPMKAAFGRWAWESATPFMDADRPAIEALIGELHARLAARDAGGVLAMLEVELEEMGRALGIPLADMVSSVQKGLDFHFRDADWRMLPLRPLELLSGAGGRVVRILDDRGEHPLQGINDERKPYELPICVSCIGGMWKVVRP